MKHGATGGTDLPTGMSVPPAPLTLNKLRDHFRQTYLLNEEQVETMVVSSSKSLDHAFTSVVEILSGAEPEKQLVAFFHGLKGLLLNMGESEWAAFTRSIEEKLAAGDQFNYTTVVAIIKKGVEEVLAYKGENGPGKSVS